MLNRINGTKRFASLVKLARQQERQAAQQLGLQQQQYQQKTRLLEQLLHYEQGYQKTIGQAAKLLTGGALQEYQRFLQQLAMMINKQQAEVQTVQQRVQQNKIHWAAKEKRLSALSKLHQKHLMQASAILRKQEQNEIEQWNLNTR